MGDIIDKGNETAEFFKELALKTRKPEGPHYRGTCWNCNDPVPHPRRWCDMDCRDDWERRQT